MNIPEQDKRLFVGSADMARQANTFGWGVEKEVKRVHCEEWVDGAERFEGNQGRDWYAGIRSRLGPARRIGQLAIERRTAQYGRSSTHRYGRVALLIGTFEVGITGYLSRQGAVIERPFSIDVNAAGRQLDAAEIALEMARGTEDSTVASLIQAALNSSGLHLDLGEPQCELPERTAS